MELRAKRGANLMTFQPGHSGNPAGRAVGSRNSKTLAAEAALFDRAQELVEDLVTRAKNGEPAAMRLVMERVLPVGRGRPLPIALPAIRSTEDAHAAAAVIMAALKDGALSAGEAVDLLRVVEGLTRLTGAIEFIKKVARREVARAAQTLGMDHFFAGPPAANDYARQTAQLNGDDERAVEEAYDPENEYRSSQDPAYRCGLQIVADSNDAHCSAAKDGPAIVNNNENTMAAADGGAAPREANDAQELGIFEKNRRGSS